MKASAELVSWLHRLDAYTNTEYGRARTLSAIADECVGCGRPSNSRDPRGLCPACVAQRRSDLGELHLFRPLRRESPA